MSQALGKLRTSEIYPKYYYTLLYPKTIVWGWVILGFIGVGPPVLTRVDIAKSDIAYFVIDSHGVTAEKGKSDDSMTLSLCESGKKGLIW